VTDDATGGSSASGRRPEESGSPVSVDESAGRVNVRTFNIIFLSSRVDAVIEQYAWSREHLLKADLLVVHRSPVDASVKPGDERVFDVGVCADEYPVMQGV
jgi:hypothetical protein